MTDEELFEQARAVNFAYKAAVAEVQLHILDAEWDLTGYGDSPDQCGDDRYEFELTRRTPSGWRIDGTPMETADRIAAWLDENGWTDIKTRGYSGEIADAVVEAEYPEKHVELLIVDISPGELFDSTTIYATSTCEPGDYLVISDMRRPGDGERELQPSVEHPSARPSFGYTEDGKRRFWDDAE